MPQQALAGWFPWGEIGNSRQVLLGIVLIGGLSWTFEGLIFRQIEKNMKFGVWPKVKDKTNSVKRTLIFYKIKYFLLSTVQTYSKMLPTSHNFL